MTLLEKLRQSLGEKGVLTGEDCASLSHDWTGAWSWTPLCVVRPATTQEVSEVLRIAYETETPVVPVGGNTGLAGGTTAEGAIMLSLERMNKVREIRADAKIAIVEAGVVLSQLHAEADAQDLVFPVTFGARGSCRIGGILSTNAGGSNVLRYGNTRDLVLGIEVVLADGRIMNLMSELHKDNSGYNLRHLMIGAEGTLGVITGAVVKLAPKPKAYATAMVAVRDLSAGLILLNRLQEETGGAVEAIEYMPPPYIAEYLRRHPAAREPFETTYDVNLLVEVGATAPKDATPDETGVPPVHALLENALAQGFEEGLVLDAKLAQSEAHRTEMWAMREAAGEIMTTKPNALNNDVAVPLDKVQAFLDKMREHLPKFDPNAVEMVVSHLGDGNVHYTVWPSSGDAQHIDAIMEVVEDEALALGGSFSAEHGIGVKKIPSMQRRKDQVSLDIMRAIKATLDPKGILNPGKLLP